MDTTATKLDAHLEEIARKHLDFETLATRNSDSLDFHDVAVWSLKAALLEAVELGRLLQEEEEKPEWRPLAMQFDGHRMQAIGHLRCMVQDPQGHKEQAEKFLSAGPLSGEKVLAERIQAIAALRLGPPQIVKS
jgi:hypothetical protein